MSLHSIQIPGRTKIYPSDPYSKKEGYYPRDTLLLLKKGTYIFLHPKASHRRNALVNSFQGTPFHFFEKAELCQNGPTVMVLENNNYFMGLAPLKISRPGNRDPRQRDSD